MRYCKFRHVIPLLSQCDKIIVYPSLVFSRVIEIEAFGLHIIRCQLLALELGYFLQEALLMLQ